MKKLVFLCFFVPLLLTAQTSLAQYKLDSIKIEPRERTNEFDWYMPVKRNLDYYGPMFFGDYKFFLNDTYQRDRFVMGTGHFFDEKGVKKYFTLIFILATTSNDKWQYIHGCLSAEMPDWVYIEEDFVICTNCYCGIISAGNNHGDTRSFDKIGWH